MPKPKKYVVYQELNDQEVMIGLTDKDIMKKALRRYGIKIVRVDPESFEKKELI